MDNQCPICHRRYDFVSQGINVPGQPRNRLGFGRIVAVHPPGPCRPPAPVQYEPEDAMATDCPWCEREFRKKVGTQVFCSDKCKALFRSSESSGRCSDTPPKCCRVCGDPFVPYVRNQEICRDPDCKRARQRKYKSSEWSIYGEVRKYLKRKAA